MINQECKLCGKKSIIVKSHIIPKFINKILKKDGSKNLYFFTKERISKVNGLFYEYLFCQKFENIFNQYENYVSNLWYHFDVLYENHNQFIKISNVDSVKFHLFLLSIVLRTKLQRKHEILNSDLPTDDIINCLINQESCYNKYPVILIKLNSFSLVNDFNLDFTQLVQFPEEFKFFNFQCYRFTIMGLQTIIFIDSDFKAINSLFNNHFSITSNNDIKLWTNFNPDEMIKYIANMIQLPS